jgi:type I restriction enzyme S subunit
MTTSETKFKETEIGSIPEGWEVVNIDEALYIIDGDRGTNYPNGSDFSGNDYCLFLNAKNVSGSSFDFSNCQFISKIKDSELRKGKMQTGDFVLTTRGTVGNIAFYDDSVPFENMRINSGMVILRNKKVFDLKFLFQLMKSKFIENQISDLTTGSAQPQLPIKDLKYLKLIKPSQTEQKQIAGILSSLDDKIELNRKINANLEKLAMALFKKWFVDIGDELPEGWKIQKIGNVVAVKGGSTPDTTKPEYWHGGSIAWVTPKDLSNLNSVALLDTEKKITKSGLDKISSGLLPSGTILLSSRAPIGYVAVTNIPVAINQGFIAINADSTIQGYILFWVKNNIDLIESRANGSTFLEINKTNFRDINILVPDVKTLKKFEGVADSVVETIIQNECEIKNLSFIRNSLLPRLMSGKIRV